MEHIKDKQPVGLWLICATEIFERFSYYAMRALLILYFVYALKMNRADASNLYGSFTSLVYLSGIVGGYVADRFIGQKLAIIWGAIMIAIGQFMLGFENIGMIYTALGFLIMGNGFFKISISTFVGSLYEKNDPRRDGGFTYFYMAVNIGAFFAGIIGGGIGEKFGWRYGFWLAGIVMILGLFIFLWGKEKYFKGVGDRPQIAKGEWGKAAINGGILLLVALVIWKFGFWIGAGVLALCVAILWAKKKAASKGIEIKSELTHEEKMKVLVIFILAFFVIFFWTAFEQSGAALNLFAYEHTNRMLFGWEVPATWFQSLNPVFVVLFAPIFSKMWLNLAAKGKEPSTPAKFVWALWLLAAGYVVLLIAAMQMGPGVKVNMMYLVITYAAFTTGELCLSPVGLSLVTKLAPVQFVGTLMGVWKLANAAANKLAGFYSSYFGVISNEAFFGGLIVAPIVASVILISIMKPLKRWMGDVR
ncbi:POT family proton-dependent oligopeptide transporter [Elusimicrobium simillimum]|uniref:peptide MFS transporter n=1 Tax=Elusimicrobium simillimum TaxID=3143438 RepID=UPI003C6F43B2